MSTLSAPRGAQVLEARFYPRTKQGRQVLRVGRVICLGASAVVEPAAVDPRALAPFHVLGVETKLRFLVASAYPDAARELPLLRSDYWEFVAVAEERAPDEG